jgi:hypothetical protein
VLYIVTFKLPCFAPYIEGILTCKYSFYSCFSEIIFLFKDKKGTLISIKSIKIVIKIAKNKIESETKTKGGFLDEGG